MFVKNYLGHNFILYFNINYYQCNNCAIKIHYDGRSYDNGYYFIMKKYFHAGMNACFVWYQ